MTLNLVETHEENTTPAFSIITVDRFGEETLCYVDQDEFLGEALLSFDEDGSSRFGVLYDNNETHSQIMMVNYFSGDLEMLKLVAYRNDSELVLTCCIENEDGADKRLNDVVDFLNSSEKLLMINGDVWTEILSAYGNCMDRFQQEA
ncbi:hypothetical protein RISINGSUN_167 [Erwinia phage vB_EamM_RisingSun]|uniref:Uncharacterized protein n=1 Tax=Erwinia phage vB_EamM_RisingSun TaxID=2026080 RepID=A0A223LI05_9CAUD|nr:hypothetical protein FDI45_gp167 [Erwinia phage vB_EamM_RisingSun]ASU03503.1 hypothetical protein RISINGSUN_167 [Erwinia phage vB_EamM_RisingSun]